MTLDDRADNGSITKDGVGRGKKGLPAAAVYFLLPDICR
jgi:hypothetical protein